MLAACRLAGLSALIPDYGVGDAPSQFPNADRRAVWHFSKRRGDADVLSASSRPVAAPAGPEIGSGRHRAAHQRPKRLPVRQWTAGRQKRLHGDL